MLAIGTCTHAASQYRNTTRPHMTITSRDQHGHECPDGELACEGVCSVDETTMRSRPFSSSSSSGDLDWRPRKSLVRIVSGEEKILNQRLVIATRWKIKITCVKPSHFLVARVRVTHKLFLSCFNLETKRHELRG